jgi:D-alanine-D-alanine ligase
MNNKKLDIEVVLIADTGYDRDKITLERTDLEFAEPDYLACMQEVVEGVVSKLWLYDSPSSFLNNVKRHKDSLVLSIWSGQNSRNRKALVSSICEAYGIRYVGADTYTNIICQDKYLSKQICERYGLRTPRGVLVESQAHLDLVDLLHPPLVVKPNFEGGSIGISQKNMTKRTSDAKRICLRLMRNFKQPILVEEFAEGREISLVMVGSPGKIILAEAVELALEGIDLSRTIFGYELKKTEPFTPITHKLITSELPSNFYSRAERLFDALEKVDVIRVDGRLLHGDISVIELSPDVHFGRGCTVAAAFELKGIGYEEMIRKILVSSLEHQSTPTGKCQ